MLLLLFFFIYFLSHPFHHFLPSLLILSVSPTFLLLLLLSLFLFFIIILNFNLFNKLDIQCSFSHNYHHHYYIDKDINKELFCRNANNIKNKRENYRRSLMRTRILLEWQLMRINDNNNKLSYGWK